MWFKLRGLIRDKEIIAVDKAIRELRRIERAHGPGRWRKLKGNVLVELPSGKIVRAEVHWYEAHGHGRKELKIKRILE